MQHRQHVHRRDVANFIYSIWTRDGSDIAGLAFPLFEGQVDALGMFMTGSLFLDDTDVLNSDVEQNEIEIERVHSDKLTYAEFCHNYMSKNKPVIILGLSKKWRATSKWTVSDPFSTEECDRDVKMVPNLSYLKQKFGGDIVSVHLQPSSGGFIGSSNRARQKEEMTLNDFADWWFDYHLLLSEKEEDRKSRNKDFVDTDEGEDILYMKDWKFVAEHPKYKAYTTPTFFADDWLNGPTGMGNAYKFCYLGPKGTVTPLHADVLNSYSWSTNICGRKRWYMVPSECTHLLYDVFGRKLATHMHADQDDYIGDDLGTCLYPGLIEARRSTLCFIQEEGETLFVPSGWHHTVENIEPTLSINHNWLNSNNILWSWDRILSESVSEHKQEKHFARKESSIETQPAGYTAGAKLNGKGSQEIEQGDDLQLLWLIISRKAKEILSENRNGSFNTLDTGLTFSSTHFATSAYGLKKVLRILKNMQNFFQRCSVDGWSRYNNIHIDKGDIQNLITEINVYFNTLVKEQVCCCCKSACYYSP